MKIFFENMSYKLSGLLVGRYGPDPLSKALSGFAIASLVISLFLKPFYIVAIVLLVWCYFRIFSKNQNARRKELYAYLNLKNRVISKAEFIKRRWRERKTHRFFKCKNCKTNLRVPKGKGKIEITCKVCGRKMIKKS